MFQTWVEGPHSRLTSIRLKVGSAPGLPPGSKGGSPRAWKMPHQSG
ncbi:rCG37219 [Rattus norvegicus]|uniref:RCG37219 n=1 Tax=Rattus norvegicus TaxID=10116 RepID=A6KT16_RAT|nr:rCG37219 [Rattus norvegicus]